MTIASKENIPITTTAMNSSASSTSSPAVGMESTAFVKEDVIVGVENLDTAENSSTEAINVAQTAKKVIENTVSKKRQIEGTVETTERNGVDGTTYVDTVVVDDKVQINEDDCTNESLIKPSLLLETAKRRHQHHRTGRATT